MFQPTVVCLNIPRVFFRILCNVCYANGFATNFPLQYLARIFRSLPSKIYCLFSNEFIILRGFIVRYVTFYSHVKVVFIPQCRNGLHHRRSMMHI